MSDKFDKISSLAWSVVFTRSLTDAQAHSEPYQYIVLLYKYLLCNVFQGDNKSLEYIITYNSLQNNDSHHCERYKTFNE